MINKHRKAKQEKIPTVMKLQRLTGRQHGGNDVEVSHARDLGAAITNNFELPGRCINVTHYARGDLLSSCQQYIEGNPEASVSLYTTILRPHLEYRVQLWPPCQQKDEFLIKARKLTTEMMSDQRH